jgi:hypothetical protein
MLYQLQLLGKRSPSAFEDLLALGKVFIGGLKEE